MPDSAPGHGSRPHGSRGRATRTGRRQCRALAAGTLLAEVLVPGHGSDPGLKMLSEELALGIEAELRDLRQLLTDTGVPETNPHEGHAMPGMVTDEHLVAATGVRGGEFDILLAGHLRRHLEQTARVSRARRESGRHPAAVTLAAGLTENATSHLDSLDQLTA